MKKQTTIERTAQLMRTGLAAVVLTGGAAMLATAVSAQTAPTTQNTESQANPNSDAKADAHGTTPMMHVTDAQFIMMAGQGNSAEIADARYILAHSKNPLVRQFAQKMVDDHSQASVNLETVSHGVAVVPTKPSPADMMMMRQLSSLSGQKLDDAYMTDQVEDHRKMLALLNSEAAQTQNPSLKSFALAQAQVVNGHLQSAQAYQVTSGTSLGETPRVGNGVTPGVPTGGSKENGISRSNGSSQTGGTSAATGAGVSGSNTGQMPATGPTAAPQNMKPTPAPTTTP
jgi:putative membrane protein